MTEEQIELDEYTIDALNAKLRMLADVISDHPKVLVTYFQPDKRKAGGAYITVSGTLKKIDDYEGIIVLEGGEKIILKDILDIECDDTTF